MKYLLAFLFLVSVARATDYTAAACSRAAVVTAIGLASDGDTVIIPTGTTSDWTSQLTITKAITLKGSGYNDNGTADLMSDDTWGTIIVDSSGTGDVSAISFSTASGKAYRLSQIQFNAGSVHASGSENGCVRFGGVGNQNRIDHCKFNNPSVRHVGIQGGAYGVSDHCWHYFTGSYQCYLVKNGNPSGGVNGNDSWAASALPGSANAWYIENCYFTDNGATTIGITDSWEGGRYVLRYNTGTTAQFHFSNHGTDSSQQLRSGRLIEAYRNTITSTSNHGNLVEYRGGTGVQWGNSYTMSGATSMTLTAYRVDGSMDQPWGPADGTLLWDAADTSDTFGTAGDGIFETGTSNPVNVADSSVTSGITITQSGNTVTASSSIFTAAMVGKGIRWNPYDPATTDTIISSYVDTTHVTVVTNRTRSSPSAFVIGDAKVITDTTKSWTPSQWVGYVVRPYHNFTGTSGTTTTVTVAGAGWRTNQWSGWMITRTSNGQKGSVASNTADTITLSSTYYQPSFASGVLDFQVNQSGRVVSNTATALTIASQHDFAHLFDAAHPYELRRVSFSMDQPGAGASSVPSPTSKPPHQSLGQTHAEPLYAWSNLKSGSQFNLSSNFYSIQANRDYYNETGSFTGSTGIGVGTLAARPSSGLTAGVGYWVTDEGEWDSTNGATPDGQLYVATGATTWALYYTPYTYPHPLVSGAVDVTVPVITSVTVSGSTATINYSESVISVNAAHYILSGGRTLSAATGSGASRTMTITPASVYGETYTLSYSAGGTTDLALNVLADFSGMAVTNSNVDSGTPPVRNPGRVRVNRIPSFAK